MTGPPPLIAAWPALMTLDMAAHYLSLDKQTFCRVTAGQGIHPVALDDDEQRWRKTDLDKLIRKLPEDLKFGARATNPKVMALDNAAIDRIAEQVTEKIQRAPAQKTPQLVSIRDAATMLGLGRSTIYRLMESGRLSKRNIGRRTLIMRSDIDRILKDTGTD